MQQLVYSFYFPEGNKMCFGGAQYSKNFIFYLWMDRCDLWSITCCQGLNILLCSCFPVLFWLVLYVCFPPLALPYLYVFHPCLIVAPPSCVYTFPPLFPGFGDFACQFCTSVCAPGFWLLNWIKRTASSPRVHAPMCPSACEFLTREHQAANLLGHAGTLRYKMFPVFIKFVFRVEDKNTIGSWIRNLDDAKPTCFYLMSWRSERTKRVTAAASVPAKKTHHLVLLCNCFGNQKLVSGRL